MANNTYIGGEIKLIGGLSDLFAIDSNIIRYTKTDNEEISIQQIINELLGRINALEESNITKEYDLTVSLTGCSSATLKPGKISENGGTYTVTADTHYNLPSSITVTQGSTTLIAGTHYIWSSGTLRILPGITGPISVTITATPKTYSITISGNATGNKSSVIYTTSNVQVTLSPNTGYTVTGATVSGATFVSFSNNVVTFNNITGNITITVQTEEILLGSVTVTKSGGTGTLSGDTGDTISLKGKGSSITLTLDSKPDNALNTTMTLAATNSAGSPTTVLGLNKDSVSDRSTVSLTPTGVISGAKLKISNNKGTLLKTLIVNVADGSTTAVSVKNSSNGTSSNLNSNGGAVTLTATVTSTKFNPGVVTWETTGGSFDVTTGNRVTFTAPANDSETNNATYTITARCDGKSAIYSVTVAKKAASTKYYWYVGQINPTSMGSISPIVNDNTSPGWRLIGTSIPAYTFDNPLYNASANPIVSNPSKNDYWYIALPEKSSLSVYDSDDVNQLTNGNWTKESSQFSDNNTKYNIYKIAVPQRKFIGLWVH